MKRHARTKAERALRAAFVYLLDIRAEDVPVRGNALASGDDAVDREAEDEIIARLDGGDEWAWCTVRVTARHPDVPTLEGVAFLGCCSYRDEAEFRQLGGYFDDMKAEVADDLDNQLDDVRRVLARTRRVAERRV